MNYVDGFVVPVPKKKVAAYRSMAKLSAKVWLEHGALEFYESVADDVPYGKRTSFPRSVKLKRGETVVFSWIIYKSRAHRDKVMAKVMKDPRIAKMMQRQRPAVRRQAHDLRRLQDDRRGVTNLVASKVECECMSLTLHFHPLSSFCHKVLIALYENDTPFEQRIVNLMDPAEAAAFKKLWPCGQFPVLQDGRPHDSGVEHHHRASRPALSGKDAGSFRPIPKLALAGAAEGSLLRSAASSAYAEGRRRPAAPGRQERPAWRRGCADAPDGRARHDRCRDGRQDLGHGR